MSDEAIRLHKQLASGGGLPDVPAIENPFCQVRGSSIPRGEMKDSKRKAGDQDRDSD